MLKPSQSRSFIGRRHEPPKTTSSGIALPDVFLKGNSEFGGLSCIDTEYKKVTILSLPRFGSDPELKVGDVVYIHELDQVFCGSEEPDVQKFPVSCILARLVDGDIKPFSDRVLVKRVLGEEKTAGGLWLPDLAKEKPHEAVVLAVGPGKLIDKTRVPMNVEPGDKVVLDKYMGTEIKEAGLELILISEQFIQAVYKPICCKKKKNA